MTCYCKLISCLMLVLTTVRGTTSVREVNGFVSLGLATPTQHSSWGQSSIGIQNRSNNKSFELRAQHKKEERESSFGTPSESASLPFISSRDSMEQQQEQQNIGDAVLSLKDYLALETCSLATTPPTSNCRNKDDSDEKKLIKERFVFGRKLQELRSQIVNLQKELQQKQKQRTNNQQEVNYLRQSIRRLQLKDADFVYKELCDIARRSSNKQDKEMFLQEAMKIKETCLQQYNLEGYWIGQYPKGKELVYISFLRDNTLVARKVATSANGDNSNIQQNVPQDEVTFTANLVSGGISSQPTTSETAQQPLTSSDDNNDDVPCIQRFLGKGQVSNNGYQNAQYVEGQLIVFPDAAQFSFVWEPIGIQVFFERPSDQQLLQMFRQKEEQQKIEQELVHATIVGSDNVEQMRRYIMRCYESSEDDYEDHDDSTTKRNMMDESIFLEPNNDVHFQ